MSSWEERRVGGCCVLLCGRRNSFLVLFFEEFGFWGWCLRYGYLWLRLAEGDGLREVG